MTNLTQKQLRKIREQVSDGVELKEVLLNQFPDAEIYVIRGYDNFNYEAYVEGAFFDYTRASQLMERVYPNGTLSDTYHVVIGTIGNLTNGGVSDKKTGQALDNIDMHMIYSSLERGMGG